MIIEDLQTGKVREARYTKDYMVRQGIETLARYADPDIAPSGPAAMYNTLRCCLLAVLVVVAPLAGALGINYASGNVHRIDATFYRSGHLPPTQLDELIHTSGIRSILNLRGDHPSEEWWRDETWSPPRTA